MLLQINGYMPTCIVPGVRTRGRKLCAGVLTEAGYRSVPHGHADDLLPRMSPAGNAVRVVGNGKNYTMLDNAGNAVCVAMPEETYIDILAITGGNLFAALILVNGDIWELIMFGAA